MATASNRFRGRQTEVTGINERRPTSVVGNAEGEMDTLSSANRQVNSRDSPDASDKQQPDLLNHGKMAHALVTSIGADTTVATVNGVFLKGFFHSSNNNGDLVLQQVTEMVEHNALKNVQMEHVYVDKLNLVDATFKNVDLVNGFRHARRSVPSLSATSLPTGSLSTDADLLRVPRAQRTHQPKELVPWEAEDGSAHREMPLEAEAIGGWTAEAMFIANARLADRQSDFDPSMPQYTLPLVRENTKEYRDREAEAARMARDIEKNPEFRTRNNERDLTDEEEAFSEVKRERIPHSATEYSRNFHTGSGSGSNRTSQERGGHIHNNNSRFRGRNEQNQNDGDSRNFRHGRTNDVIITRNMENMSASGSAHSPVNSPSPNMQQSGAASVKRFPPPPLPTQPQTQTQSHQKPESTVSSSGPPQPPKVRSYNQDYTRPPPPPLPAQDVPAGRFADHPSKSSSSTTGSVSRTFTASENRQGSGTPSFHEGKQGVRSPDSARNTSVRSGSGSGSGATFSRSNVPPNRANHESNSRPNVWVERTAIAQASSVGSSTKPVEPQKKPVHSSPPRAGTSGGVSSWSSNVASASSDHDPNRFSVEANKSSSSSGAEQKATVAVASTEASSSAKEDAGSTGEMEDQAGSKSKLNPDAKEFRPRALPSPSSETISSNSATVSRSNSQDISSNSNNNNVPQALQNYAIHPAMTNGQNMGGNGNYREYGGPVSMAMYANGHQQQQHYLQMPPPGSHLGPVPMYSPNYPPSSLISVGHTHGPPPGSAGGNYPPPPPPQYMYATHLRGPTQMMVPSHSHPQQQQQQQSFLQSAPPPQMQPSNEQLHYAANGMAYMPTMVGSNGAMQSPSTSSPYGAIMYPNVVPPGAPFQSLAQPGSFLWMSPPQYQGGMPVNVAAPQMAQMMPSYMTGGMGMNMVGGMGMNMVPGMVPMPVPVSAATSPHSRLPPPPPLPPQNMNNGRNGNNGNGNGNGNGHNINGQQRHQQGY